MRKFYDITVVMENNNQYRFSCKTRYNKLNFIIPNEKSLLAKINLLVKILIGDKLYFNNVYNEYYYITTKNFTKFIYINDIKGKLIKTSYKSIKKRNKYLFEIDAIDIINIIKTNKLNKKELVSLDLVKKHDALYLYVFIYDDKYLIIYKFNNNKFIFDKKYKMYDYFLIDEDNNLFCMYDYNIIPVSKQFKHFNYINYLMHHKKRGFTALSDDIPNIFDICYFIRYEACIATNEINFNIRNIFYNFKKPEDLEFKFRKYNNKIEIFSNRKIGIIPFLI